MATKTIGLDEEAYERLAAESHDDESFSETVKRITEEVASDWRRGFGRFAEGESAAEAFAETMDSVRANHGEGIGKSHSETLEALGFDLDANGNIRSKPDSGPGPDVGSDSDFESGG
jgi:predicted CopG family antitoxin